MTRLILPATGPEVCMQVQSALRPGSHRLRRVATPDNADGGSNRATARRMQVASPDSYSGNGLPGNESLLQVHYIVCGQHTSCSVVADGGCR
jgi:hypothetical protein